MANLPKHEFLNEQLRTQRKHFVKWSKRFNFAKAISLLAFFSTILIAFIFFSDSITYKNFQLLIRNIDSEYYSSAENLDATIYYNSDENTVFEEFDGNLVIAGNGGVSLYSMSGRKIFSYNDKYGSPQIAVSDKYFVVYELNGNTFSVYSKVGQLFKSSDCEFPITSAVVSDSGRFAIATKSRESSTSVILYNEKFSVIGKYENSRQLISCALSDDGKYIAFATVDAQNGIFKTVITMYKTSNASEIFKSEKEGTFPLKAFFTEKNKLLLCCRDAFYVYNTEGALISMYEYDGNIVSSISFNGEDKLALTFSSDKAINKSSLYIIDIKGKVIYNNEDMKKVDDSSFCGETLFLLSQTDVSAVFPKGKIKTAELRLPSIAKRVFAYSEESVIVAGDTSAVIESFK